MTATRPGPASHPYEFVGKVASMQASLGRKVGTMGSPEDLAALAELIDELKAVETKAALQLQEQGFSWNEIGAAQGITGQSAWKKYRRTSRATTRKHSADGRIRAYR